MKQVVLWLKQLSVESQREIQHLLEQPTESMNQSLPANIEHGIPSLSLTSWALANSLKREQFQQVLRERFPRFSPLLASDCLGMLLGYLQITTNLEPDTPEPPQNFAVLGAVLAAHAPPPVLLGQRPISGVAMLSWFVANWSLSCAVLFPSTVSKKHQMPDLRDTPATFVDPSSPTKAIQTFLALVDANNNDDRNDLLVLLGPSGTIPLDA